MFACCLLFGKKGKEISGKCRDSPRTIPRNVLVICVFFCLFFRLLDTSPSFSCDLFFWCEMITPLITPTNFWNVKNQKRNLHENDTLSSPRKITPSSTPPQTTTSAVLISHRSHQKLLGISLCNIGGPNGSHQQNK